MSSQGIGRDPADRCMRLGDGRRLTWREYGNVQGHPVIALHGTPGSREKFAIASGHARKLGLRLICPDRWGYGGSDAPRTGTLVDYARDCLDLAGYIGAERFSLVGVSGGGPYAAAIAAASPERIAALALVAPVGPIRGTATAPEMTLFHQFCFKGLPHVPGAIRIAFSFFRTVLAVSPRGAITMATARAGRGDKMTVRKTVVQDRLAETFRLGLAPGCGGPVRDMLVFARPWRVPLHAICAPARLWIGSDDRNVPITAATCLARAIPGCELTRIEGAGHFWVTSHYDEVMDWVAKAAAVHKATAPF